MSKVLSFGAILWDIIEGIPYVGGAPFNVAAHLAKCGVPSYMLTCVGRDDFGRRSLAEIERLGVQQDYVQFDSEHPTGTVVVSLSETGQPSYDITDNVAYDYIRVDEASADAIAAEGFAAFCFGTMEQRRPVARRSLYHVLERLKDVHVLYDVNLRLHYYSREMVQKSLKHTTILKLNDEETGVLSEMLFEKPLSQEDFARRVRGDYEIDTVVVTRGAEGCLLVGHDGVTEFAGVSVKVADAVGAGDAFAAGFLAGVCSGESLEQATQFANRLGAFVASQRGAVPEYDQEIADMIENNRAS